MRAGASAGAGTYVRTYVYVCVCVCVSLCVCVCACVCMYVHMHMFKRASVYAPACVCMRVYTFHCIRVSADCLSLYPSICTCVPACTWVIFRLPSLRKCASFPGLEGAPQASADYDTLELEILRRDYGT